MAHRHVDVAAAMRLLLQDKMRLRQRGTKRRGAVASRHHGHEAVGASDGRR